MDISIDTETTLFIFMAKATNWSVMFHTQNRNEIVAHFFICLVSTNLSIKIRSTHLWSMRESSGHLSLILIGKQAFTLHYDIGFYTSMYSRRR